MKVLIRMMIPLSMLLTMMAHAQDSREVMPEAATEKGLIELIYHGQWDNSSKAAEIGVRGIPAVRINGKVFQIETESGFELAAPRYPEIVGLENVEVGMMATVTYVTHDNVSYVQSMLIE